MTNRTRLYLYFYLLFYSFFSTVILSFGQSWSSHVQDIGFKFDHYTLKDGLSQGTVLCIFQDTNGFIWIGTEDGLNRFDGYEFKVYKNIHSDPSSLSHNAVSSIIEDKNGYIWVGTVSGGLNRFDPNTGKFARYFEILADSTCLNSNSIRSIFEDSQGRLWVSSYSEGSLFLLYVPEKNNFQRHKIEYEKDRSKNAINNLTTFYEDRFGKIWLGTDQGIYIYDPEKKEFIHSIKHEQTSENTILNNHVTSIYESSNGTIWVVCKGFINVGLSKILLLNDSYDLEIRNYPNDSHISPTSVNLLMDDDRNNIIEDGDGNLWIGSKAGISIFNLNKKQFKHIKHNSLNPNTIKEGAIFALFKDRSGSIWIGYRKNGLSKLRHNKGFKHIQRTHTKNSGLLSNNATSILQDKHKNLWVGSFPDGLNKIVFSDHSYESYQATHFEQNPSGNEGNIIGAGTIVSLLEDNLGFIWIGTHSGLFRYNGDGKGFDHFYCDPSHNKDLFVEEIRSMNQQSSCFWVATNKGLYQKKNLSDSNVTFERFYPTDSLTSSFETPVFIDLVNDCSDNLWAFTLHGKILYFDTLQQNFKEPVFNCYIPPFNINTVLFSTVNELWIGTSHGILRFEIIESGLTPTLKLIRSYTGKDGLPNGIIHKILEDHHGDLWISHNSGLSRLNTKTGIFVNYEETDGLQDNEFNIGSGSQLEGGYLSFGGVSGVTIFHPDSLKSNFSVPKVRLTQIKTTTNEYLNPSALKVITLNYLQNIVSFKFSSFDFIVPQKNKYSHQLVGFDKDWVYSEYDRTVTYTHLDPGKYTFRVKSLNNNGSWNEEVASIDMIILPPPWRTWWAYSIYILVGLMFLLAARREILKSERLKSNMKLKELEAEKYHELNTIKSRFFANISHEFRTPLTLLLCPIEKWQSKVADHQLKTDLKIMYRNASRLLTLVNQLLELSHLEAGTLKLRAESADLTVFIRNISCQFSSIANHKKIDFKIRSHDHIILYFDKEKLQKVIVNLLSNAFKFTGEGGSIQIDLCKADKDEQFLNGYAEIRISDTGMGINVEHLTKIFDRFYQADNSLIRHYEGSGIGLALAKELVELHHGSINATSVEGEGSSFIIRLPFGSSHLAPEELSNSHEIEVLSSAPSNIHPLMENETLEKIQGNGQGKEIDTPRILIVDDNEDFRCYLRCNLALQYNVMEATDGESGLATALNEIPDLIISDIIMPIMDGFEMCKRIKHNEKTSHIPVILLTAKADQPSIINGIGIGADDFISKPFHVGELIVRIKNVIEIRKKLIQKFSNQMVLKPSEIKVESLDTKFLKRVISIIEEHLDDNLLHVDMLSKEANMSSIQLNRKLKALTGSTPNDMIRSIRLERAASLLEQNAGNVAEIAFSVGFNNLSYFSKCFREKFNTTPHEFRKTKKE